MELRSQLFFSDRLFVEKRQVWCHEHLPILEHVPVQFFCPSSSFLIEKRNNPQSIDWPNVERLQSVWTNRREIGGAAEERGFCATPELNPFQHRRRRSTFFRTLCLRRAGGGHGQAVRSWARDKRRKGRRGKKVNCLISAKRPMTPGYKYRDVWHGSIQVLHEFITYH